MGNDSGSDSSSSSDGGGRSGQFGLGKSHHRLVIGRVDPRTSLAFYFDGPIMPSSSKSRRRAATPAGGGSRGENQEHEEQEVLVF